MVPKKFSLPSQMASFRVEVTAGQPRAVWELHQWHVAVRDAAGIIDVLKFDLTPSTSPCKEHTRRSIPAISFAMICDLGSFFLHDPRHTFVLCAPFIPYPLIRCNDGSTDV